ncbi:MAG: TauD/TfdA family dioxygenase [SAR324 cluster bacterium]|nr:TauD/TfdA family dioxygenase [SAR324 cluster bacterium]
MELNMRKLGNFCMEILDLDLTTVDEDTRAAVRRAWQTHPLLLLRRQSLTEGELLDFSRGFGELEVVVREDIHSRRHPEIAYISNLRDEQGRTIGGLGSYDLRWHTDQSYRTKPATGAIFLAVEVPEQGGNTWWANTEMAYDNLPQSLQEELQDCQGMFKYLMYDSDIVEEQEVKDIRGMTPDATHPLVLTHPLSGRKSLYLDITQTFGIVGMPPERSEPLLKELKAIVSKEEFIYSHQWRVGDVMMWDNSRLQHRRDPYDAALPRLAKRTTIFLPPSEFPVPYQS